VKFVAAVFRRFSGPDPFSAMMNRIKTSAITLNNNSAYQAAAPIFHRQNRPENLPELEQTVVC
jgi:hypothetical protein